MLRLAHLALTNTFALIRMLPMSDRGKDVEILALRHQLAVLQRKVGKPAFTPNDRTLLAALLHHLPAQKLRQLHLLMRPGLVEWAAVQSDTLASPGSYDHRERHGVGLSEPRAI